MNPEIHCWSKAHFILSLLLLNRRNQTDIYFFLTLPQAVATIEPWTAMILFLNSVGKPKMSFLSRSSWQLLLLSAHYTNLDILLLQAHFWNGTPLSDFHIQKSSMALNSSRAKPNSSSKHSQQFLISPQHYSSWGPRILAVLMLCCSHESTFFLVSTFPSLLPSNAMTTVLFLLLLHPCVLLSVKV